MELNRENVMKSYGVHSFAKWILEESLNHDPVDAMQDIELALAVVKQELQKLIYKP